MMNTQSAQGVYSSISDLFGVSLGPEADAASAKVLSRPVQLRCEDGADLAGTWFEPAGDPRAVAVVNPATGVRRAFYKPFAEWLAGQGYSVLTYDYRGIGDSLSGPIRQSTATLLDWGRMDIPAALREARKRDKPILLVGHSSGGNLLSFAEGYEQAEAIVVVGSQLADWRYWQGWQRWLTLFFFNLLLPVLTRVFGHLPGWVLGDGTAPPLPRGVALQWARWGRLPDYYFGSAETADLHRAEAFRGPYHAYSISDDIFAPPPAVAALVRRHAHSRHTIFPVGPADLGVRSVGHFGLFRRKLGARIWPDLLARIEVEAPALRRAPEARR